MEGTETGWGRPAEPAPRWRALLDRALLGGRTGEQQQIDPAGEPPTADGRPPPASDGRRAADPPLPPRRPVNPLERRRPTTIERRPNPLEPRPVNPLDPRPVNPLDPRRARAAEPAAGRVEAPGRVSPPAGRATPPANGHPVDPPHAFFNPPARTAPVRPPVEPAFPARPVAEPGYPAAPEPGYLRAPEPGPAVAEPGYPPPVGYGAGPAVAAVPGPLAGIEWRQSRTDSDTEWATGVLRRSFGGPRVLAFANPKGGVHKTTATVLAAATVGGVRGRGVLAWDDNELRGTLGLRAGSARHARTIRHLVSDLALIEASHGTELTDRLDDYLRHASDGSYDVLAGEENPRFAQRLDQHTVRRVLELLRRTHDVICVDTGNNVESVNWQTVIRAADQLVITTVPREDAAFTADWMLDLLHEIGLGELADNAVTLLSCPTPGQSPLLDDLKRHFATRTRAVTVVPYDPVLETGSSIEYGQVQAETRQAWLRAAAVMLEPFAR